MSQALTEKELNFTISINNTNSYAGDCKYTNNKKMYINLTQLSLVCLGVKKVEYVGSVVDREKIM